MDSLKGRLIGVQIKEFDCYFYRLFGFPLALQVWFYESCGYCDSVMAVHAGSLIPRCLNWGDSSVLTFKKLNSSIFNLSASQVFDCFSYIFRFCWLLLFVVAYFFIFIYLFFSVVALN